jgi:hypothetical protein
VISSALRFHARNVAGRLFEIATEHQRGAVAMGLAKLVARRDVGDAVGEAEIVKPRRLGDVEMIDRVQVVIEAGLGGFGRHQPAPIGEPALDQQNFEPGPGQIGAQHHAVLAGPDDDAVIGPVQRMRHRMLPFPHRNQHSV